MNSPPPRFNPSVLATRLSSFPLTTLLFSLRCRGVCVMQVGNDWFLLANDFAGYLAAQEEVDAVYKDQSEWLRR
jgi:hypothetical protein